MSGKPISDSRFWQECFLRLLERSDTSSMEVNAEQADAALGAYRKRSVERYHNARAYRREIRRED